MCASPPPPVGSGGTVGGGSPAPAPQLLLPQLADLQANIAALGVALQLLERTVRRRKREEHGQKRGAV